MSIYSEILTGLSFDEYCKAEYLDKYGVLTEIKLFVKDYSGSSEYINLADPPLLIKQLGEDDDLTQVIKGSEATLNVICESDLRFFDLLYGRGNMEIMMKVWKDGDPFWSGWVIPSLYSEQYIATPYNVQLKAVDGLALLKDIEWKDANGDNYWEVTTMINVICNCLSRTRVGLAVVDAYNLWPNGFAGDSPLNDIWIETGSWLWEKNCYEVLELLLKPYVRLFQFKGKWVIARVTLLAGGFDGLIYTYLGATVGETITYDEVRDLVQSEIFNSATNLVMTDGSGLISAKPASYSVTLKHLLKRRPSSLGLAEFNDNEWNGNTLLYWTEAGKLATDQYYKYYDDVIKSNCLCIDVTYDIVAGLLHYYVGTTLAYAISQTSNFLRIDLNLRFEGMGTPTGGDTYLFYMEITIGGYYLKEDNTWYNSQQYYMTDLTEDAYNSGFINVSLFSIETFPATGTLYVRVRPVIPNIIPLTLTGGKTYIDYVRVTLEKENTPGTRAATEEYNYPETEEEEIVLNANASQKQTEDLEYSMGDISLSIATDRKLIYDNWCRTNAADINEFAENSGMYPLAPMFSVIRDFIKRNFSTPLTMLSMSVLGKVNFMTAITDTHLNSVLIPNGIELDDKYQTATGTWIEINNSLFFLKVNLPTAGVVEMHIQGTAGKVLFLQWGDGQTETQTLTGGFDDIPHTFDAGKYRIVLKGDVNYITYLNAEDGYIYEIFQPGLSSILTDLYLSNNYLTGFDLATIPRGLINLFIANNLITEINGVSNSGYLEQLIANDNTGLITFDLNKLTDLVEEINLENCGLTGLTGYMPQACASVYLADNALIVISGITWNPSQVYIELQGNAIAAVDTWLVVIEDFNTSSGTINVSGGTNQSEAAFSGAGAAAIASLRLRSWTVTTNP